MKNNVIYEFQTCKFNRHHENSITCTNEKHPNQPATSAVETRTQTDTNRAAAEIIHSETNCIWWTREAIYNKLLFSIGHLRTTLSLWAKLDHFRTFVAGEWVEREWKVVECKGEGDVARVKHVVARDINYDYYCKLQSTHMCKQKSNQCQMRSNFLGSLSASKYPQVWWINATYDRDCQIITTQRPNCATPSQWW